MLLIGSLLAFIVLISVVVAVHELGHLLIARANGVFCEAFSIGFGPVLWERQDKKGTKWRISAIPLGGYVKMFGDSDISSVKEKIPDGYTQEDMEKMSPHRKKPWQRLLIAIGGPLFNFIFAIIVIFSLSIIKGLPVPDNIISVNGEDSLAYVSGIRDGDIIEKVNGQNIKTFEELRDKITTSSGKDLNLTIKRLDKTQNIVVKMYKEGDDGKVVPIKTIGVTYKGVKFEKQPIFSAFSNAIFTTYSIAKSNIEGVFKIISGKESTKNVGGIISIFKISSSSAEAGIPSFIWMMCLISIILGAMNLLPIPVLDGGTVLISSIEWIIGRPLNKKVVEYIFTAGLFIVICLMGLGMWNDISQSQLFIKLKSLFN